MKLKQKETGSMMQIKMPIIFTFSLLYSMLTLELILLFSERTIQCKYRGRICLRLVESLASLRPFQRYRRAASGFSIQCRGDLEGCTIICLQRPSSLILSQGRYSPPPLCPDFSRNYPHQSIIYSSYYYKANNNQKTHNKSSLIISNYFSSANSFSYYFHSPLYQQLKFNNIANSQMSYFQRHQKHSQNSFTSNEQNFPEENNNTAEFKKNSQSKQSYLKAFKKYYIDKLLQNKLGGSDIQTRSNQENISANKAHSHHENETKSVYRKETKSIEKEKSSVMTDCTRKSKEKSTPNKISRSKIVNLVNNNDSQLEEMLYSSINEMQREIQTYGDANDLARENKLLKCSISKLKQILKDKLMIALKKNKEELTLMFDQYSNMIKKLLQDKETLTNQLYNERSKYTNEQKRWSKIEEQYENQIRNIGEENATQITQTKQQIEQFLDMIIQYQEEANAEKLEVEKLRQKVVQLEMENDRLKNEITSQRDTKKYISFSHNQQEEEQLQKYALKIESLLTMLEQLQNQNEELNLFLKSCKCSRIQLHKTSNDSLSSNENAKQIAKKYERQLIQAEKEYIKEQTYLREVLKRKDECIDRLNLVIEELRKARYASVDRMTQDALKKQISQIMR